MSENYEKLDEAMVIMTSAHRGQFRKGSGLPYSIHPIQVMQFLHDAGVKHESILIMAILHDTLEDTTVTYGEIAAKFGNEVADVVKELTHDPNVMDKAAYMESFGGKSDAALLVKVVDRILNVREFKLTDYNYASRYRKKAYSLYREFEQRQETMKRKYGERPVREILHAIAFD